MSSSTSSSDQPVAGPRPWVALVVALVVAIALVAAAERHWRRRGHVGGIADSPQLWSLERDKASVTAPRPLVLLGASRTQYGFDMDALRAALPEHRPLMLAVNGRYPLAALKSLADDERFTGIAICDINARGLARANHAAQQDHVDYHDHQWSPSWKLHRLLLNRWQQAMAVSRPELGLPAALRRALGNGPPPRKPDFTLYADRSGYIEFAPDHAKALADYFARELAQDIERKPPPAPEAWLADLAPVRDWVARIRGRGGEVVFFESPVAGRQKAIEEGAYPRALYWDRFVAAVGGPSLHHADVPAFARLTLPDESHVSRDQRAAFTAAVVEALRARGVLR